jgi:NAD(P)-dependent dehydrogenase (short-subunit alcohol dehydrogenase family)
MAQLENRTAIVTGASSGIGLGIVARFVDEGAAVEEALNRFGELHILVNGVGNASWETSQR